MNTTYMLRAVACLAALALGSSCSGHGASVSGPGTPGAQSQPPSGPLSGWPAPAELAKHPALADYDRWHEGDKTDPTLPHQHQTTDGGGPDKKGKAASAVSNYVFGTSVLAPTWDPAVSASASDTAYVGYTFYGMNAYAGTAQVVLDWKTAPADGDLWIGLANYQTNHWQWFPSPAGGAPLPLVSFAPYLSPLGNLSVSLLVLGTTPVELNYILVGDPVSPLANLYGDYPNDPLQRIAPLAVTWDGTYSYAIGSTITAIDIDYEGDGTFDDSDTAAQFQHTYAPGDYTATLRVTDNLGHTGLDTEAIHVINPANLPPTAAFTPNNTNSTAPVTVNFDASTSSDPDGQITKYEWDFDGDGAYDYTSATPSASYTFAIAGTNTVKLRVTDADLATATYTGQVFCSNGWRHSVLQSGVVGMGDGVALVVQGAGANARACVAYEELSNRTLQFVRGTTNDGLSWTAPLKLDGDFNVHAGFSPSLVIEPISQDPYLAYGALNTNGYISTQRFITATTPAGTTWNPYTVVDTGTDLGQAARLALLGGKPLITSIYKADSSNGAEVRTYQATTLAGTAWTQKQTIVSADPNQWLEEIALVSPAGQMPLVIWTSYTADGGYLQAGSVATAADGTTWGAPFAIGATAGLSQKELSLCVSGGLPMFALGDPSSGTSLYFAKADNASGSLWNTPAVKLEGNGWSGSDCAMAVVGGKPAIAYIDHNISAVRYISAVDATGTAWNASQVVESAGFIDGPLGLAELPGNIPLVIYYDSDNSKIKSGVFF